MNIEFYNHAKKNRPIIISDNDNDGCGVRILFEYYLSKNNIEYEILQSRVTELSHLEDQLLSHELIVYTDLAPTKESYDNLIKMGKTVYILDHHETSKEHLGDLPYYFYDITKSATKIVYEFLTEGLPERARHKGIEKFVSYVNAYDLFLTDTDEFYFGKALHYDLYKHVFDEGNPFKGKEHIGYNNYVNLQIKKFNIFDDFRFTPLERKYIKESLKDEKKQLETAKKSYQKRIDNQGHYYGYVEFGSKISIVSFMLLSQIKDIEYLVICSTFKPKEQKFSLRCRPDFNIRSIAEKYGGGGHNQAAGLNIEDPDLFEKYRKGILHFN